MTFFLGLRSYSGLHRAYLSSKCTRYKWGCAYSFCQSFQGLRLFKGLLLFQTLEYSFLKIDHFSSLHAKRITSMFLKLNRVACKIQESQYHTIIDIFSWETRPHSDIIKFNKRISRSERLVFFYSLSFSNKESLYEIKRDISFSVHSSLCFSVS